MAPASGHTSSLRENLWGSTLHSIAKMSLVVVNDGPLAPSIASRPPSVRQIAGLDAKEPSAFRKL